MGKQVLTFGDAGIEKHNFCHYKSPILLENVDIENLLVSSSAGEKSYKYFIGYLYDDNKIKPLSN